MKRYVILSLSLSLSACINIGHDPDWYISHGTSIHNGNEYHSCKGGGECMEGYACVKDGCEWCGDEDGVATRCTNGND